MSTRRAWRRKTLSLAVLLAVPLVATGALGGHEIGVTTSSFKYLDEDGEIRFAPSRDDVPEAYRSPLSWTDQAWCSESPARSEVEQTVELQDIDADGESEILVFFDDECPNGRRFAFLEVVEATSEGGFSIVATVRSERGWRPELLDLEGDGRLELLGRRWSDAPELWVWQDGEYVDVVRVGACEDAYWRVGRVRPPKALEQVLAEVLELYRNGRCQRAP